MMNEELPPVDGEVLERIDRRELKPLWEEHPHHFIDDPSDETDFYIAQVCDVRGCGLGRLQAK